MSGLGLSQNGTYVTTAERGWTLPTGAIAQTFERTARSDNLTILSSGRLHLVGIYLRAGQTVTSISFPSGSTGATTPTNQWFALYSSARAKLGVTADDTTTAWASGTLKTLTLSSPYSVTASGLYYVGLMVAAAATPTLFGATVQTGVTGIAPNLTGFSSTGLTDPSTAPATAAAITSSSGLPYAYVS